MNAMYNSNLDQEKITGGIVGIWAKMSTDSILRNKLFEKGTLSVCTPFIPAHSRGVYLIMPWVELNRLFDVRFFGEALAAPW